MTAPNRAAVRLVAAAACIAAFTGPHAFAREAAAQPQPATSKVPLDYRAYDGWNIIRGVKLADDGARLAYSLAPEDGDPELVVRDFAGGFERREERGIDPAFTADGKFVVYTLRAPNAEIRAAERAHKKPEESPKNGAAILATSGTDAAVTFARVKRVAVPRDPGNDTVVFLDESAPKASASGSPASTSAPLSGAPSPSAAPSGLVPAPPAALVAASASPTATASPDDLHKPDDATVLHVDDLTRGKMLAIARVTGFALSHDGAYVVYATSGTGPSDDGIWLYDVANGTTRNLARGRGHYRNLVAAPRNERFAFETDAATFAAPAPAYAVYAFDAAAPASDLSAPLAGASSSGLPRGFAPSVNATPAFDRSGTHLYFGTAPAPTPVPSGTPEPLKVDIWSWRDETLQSQQRHDADKERKRTYLAVADASGAAPHAVAQLGSPDLRTILTNDDAAVALGLDDGPYRLSSSWEGEQRADVYAVSLATGARTLLARAADNALPDGGYARAGSLSPGGGFYVNYDEKARAWYAVRVRDRKRVDLTSKLHVAFYDELDDHPAPPPAYGFGGWLGGDGEALVLDRYDVWAIDPNTGRARDLTGGYGRAHRLRFRPLQLDPDASSFDPARPIVLAAFDDRTKDGGYFVLDPHAAAPRALVLGPKAYGGLVRARNAPRLVTFAQSYEEARDLWSLPSSDPGAALARVSDANPQLARYRWGHARLISYRSTWGVPLQGILIVPDGLSRARRAPMLVYFYERFSDDLHAMPFTSPAPGTSPCLARYVSNGYVVFIPDVAYRPGHPGQSALGSVLPGVDAALAQGYADPKRVGIAGHSWAAYQIAYMITQTDRFRAAEAGAAVADMTSAYGGIRLESGVVREGQYERGQSRIGATPWERPDLYAENSPLSHVERVHTPYLTIANDLDGAVPFSQGIEWITAMRRLGKEAYLFSFDGEDHNLVGREAQKYWTVHLDEFFDHFLLGKPEPAWMAHGVDFVDRGERPIRGLYGESP